MDTAFFSLLFLETKAGETLMQFAAPVIPCRAWLCRLTFAQPAAARRVSRFWKVLSLALEPVAVCRVCG